ncbi:cbb3-type cytochrome oxidase assembly protein CcoS [Wandonia haliotis]|uniref:cbb3-type cytochrome oxidase assembly protein CcoS n=1 Tax=Wandonia haliotis TaxID=574963 RepID=UPI0031CE1948
MTKVILLPDACHLLCSLKELTLPIDMGIIYMMIAVSLLLAIVFLVSFIWATKDGQFDDDYAPAVRILFDEETKQEKDKKQIDGNPEV